MAQLLIACAGIIILCILSNKISSRFGIPMLLGFILLGMFFGTDGVFKIAFDDFHLAENISTIALIYIIFYGGFGTRWDAAKPIALKATLLSSLGTIITALIVGFFCCYFLKFSMLEGMLVGAVLCSTDAASVFSVLRSQNLSLKNGTDSLLEMESGSNDPFSYMLTFIFLSAMETGTGISVKEMILLACQQVVIGILMGALIAFAARWFFEKFNFEVDGFDAVFIVAVALISYAVPSAIGGNGYLSAYLVGIILGNSYLENKKGLVHFFDGMTGLTQMVIFFMLGLLSYPSKILDVLIPGMIVALVLTFIARPLVVALLLTPFKVPFRQQFIISWAGLRGAASVVFAIMVAVSGVTLENDVFHIVFCVVLFSLLIQGTLLPLFAKKTGMLDESGNILKTFNDYTEDIDVHYISLPVASEHPWINKTVKEVKPYLPPETLLVFLKRGRKKIIPTGETDIKEGDILVLSALAYVDEEEIALTEVIVDKDHRWCGKFVREIKLPKGTLIILVMRGENTIIPDGNTRIENGDKVVIEHHAAEH